MCENPRNADLEITYGNPPVSTHWISIYGEIHQNTWISENYGNPANHPKTYRDIHLKFIETPVSQSTEIHKTQHWISIYNTVAWNYGNQHNLQVVRYNMCIVDLHNTRSSVLTYISLLYDFFLRNMAQMLRRQKQGVYMRICHRENLLGVNVDPVRIIEYTSLVLVFVVVFIRITLRYCAMKD
jgi:hypothetical protein